MPGGFARLAAHDDMRAVLMGEGDMSADVCVLAEQPSGPAPLSTPEGMIATPVIRRVPARCPARQPTISTGSRAIWSAARWCCA